MRFVLGCVISLMLLAGCGEDDESEPVTGAALADLMVRLDGDGRGSQAPKEVEVRCGEAQESALCTGVSSLTPEDFEPTPPNTACTQQYGGPETARVTGTLRGVQINARFSREQGCEIARWDAVMPVLDRNPIP
jgi:hypothetical protein